MRVVSVGECMIEMAPVEGAQFSRSFAGDTFNTAWYLSQLQPDWQVDYFTAVGTDTASDQMIGFIDAAGIGTDTIIRDPNRTVGLYMIELDNGERSFSYWRSQSAARQLAALSTPMAKAFDGADVIFLSGITIAILEGNGRNRLLTALEAASDAMIVFDPNIRPKLWDHPDLMRAEIMRFAEVSDVILPSYEDEAEYFSDSSQEATLERYLGAGASRVIVKNGPGEIIYSDNGKRGAFHPDAIATVVDSTAAGDSFNAGFLADYITTEDAHSAIAAGSALSARVIQARGALLKL